MPIIIDTNCISHVFSAKSTKHSEFLPVLEWIIKGKGIMLMGGSKYKKELQKTTKFIRIITLLKDIGKAIDGDDAAIDNYQEYVESLIDDSDFNDPHLAAIAVVKKCRLICSEDKSSIPFVTDKKYYPKKFKHPVFYTSSKNKKLLCDKYINASYKSKKKLKKSTSDQILKSL